MTPKHTKPAARELIIDMAHHLSTAEIAQKQADHTENLVGLGKGDKPNTRG